MFTQDPKKRKSAKYAELESDLDDEFIERWEEVLKERDIEKAKKKFAKDNEKLEAEGEKPQEKSVLEEMLEVIEQDYKRLETERGTEEAELKRRRPMEKLEEGIEALDTKIKNFKIQMVDKEEGKEVSLGTR
jgi:DNA topoisomerase-1